LDSNSPASSVQERANSAQRRRQRRAEQFGNETPVRIWRELPCSTAQEIVAGLQNTTRPGLYRFPRLSNFVLERTLTYFENCPYVVATAFPNDDFERTSRIDWEVVSHRTTRSSSLTSSLPNPNPAQSFSLHSSTTNTVVTASATSTTTSPSSIRSLKSESTSETRPGTEVHTARQTHHSLNTRHRPSYIPSARNTNTTHRTQSRRSRSPSHTPQRRRSRSPRAAPPYESYRPYLHRRRDTDRL
jgi:hypothetical protein